MFRARFIAEARYGHFADYLKAVEQLNEIARERGWAEATFWVATVGTANELIAEVDYPDLATFEREGEAQGSTVGVDEGRSEHHRLRRPGHRTQRALPDGFSARLVTARCGCTRSSRPATPKRSTCTSASRTRSVRLRIACAMNRSRQALSVESHANCHDARRSVRLVCGQRGVERDLLDVKNIPPLLGGPFSNESCRSSSLGR